MDPPGSPSLTLFDLPSRPPPLNCHGTRSRSSWRPPKRGLRERIQELLDRVSRQIGGGGDRGGSRRGRVRGGSYGEGALRSSGGPVRQQASRERRPGTTLGSDQLDTLYQLALKEVDRDSLKKHPRMTRPYPLAPHGRGISPSNHQWETSFK